MLVETRVLSWFLDSCSGEHHGVSYILELRDMVSLSVCDAGADEQMVVPLVG